MFNNLPIALLLHTGLLHQLNSSFNINETPKCYSNLLFGDGFNYANYFTQKHSTLNNL